MLGGKTYRVDVNLQLVFRGVQQIANLLIVNFHIYGLGLNYCQEKETRSVQKANFSRRKL